MKRYVNNDKVVKVQSGVLLILNSMVLTIFNFGEKYTTDIKGIFMATITVTIPIVISIYGNKNKLKIVSNNFNSLYKKIKASLFGILIMGIGVVGEFILNFLFQSPLIVYLFAHLINLFISYAVLIGGLSLVVEPGIYAIIFYLDRVLN